MSNQNIYIPYLMRIEKIMLEAPGVKTFRLKFENEEDAETFSFKAGQFGEYSIMGVGESTFCIASSPTRKGISNAPSDRLVKLPLRWHWLKRVM